jgi:hypothetical protein
MSIHIFNFFEVQNFHRIISFIFFPFIHKGLKNLYGYGNSDIFRYQGVKPTQKCTTITWSGTVFEVLEQNELIIIIRYNKIGHM